MHSPSLLLTLLSCIPALGQDAKRASPDAPDGYAPARISCPSPRPTIRNATSSTLSANETAWLSLRDNNTIPALKALIDRASLGFDSNRFIDALVANSTGPDNPHPPPRIAIAISGGGYRALMTGAGALAAWDNRTAQPEVTSDGHLAGLLQATTFLSGLSGGSWLVGTLFVQNFTTVDSLITNSTGGSSPALDTLWQFDSSVLRGPAGLSSPQYYRQLVDDVTSKADAGFTTTVTDYWGRALSYQLINATTGGPSYTFSSIANDSYFTAAQSPLPLIVAVQRQPGQRAVAPNATIFEFTPWEMGSHDPQLAAFAPLRLVGSDFSAGSVPDNGSCFAGVDNAGFVMATSSSFFNQAIMRLANSSAVPDRIASALARLDSPADRDVAAWPNPFYSPGPQSPNNSTSLALVDGGEDLQNIPFHPLLQPERAVDVIFAVDASADTPSNWPNGTAMVATYQRSQASNSPNAPFPPVPDQNTFVNLGLNRRPTFFGCPDTSPGSSPSSPLVVYLPNAPYSTDSNVSTLDLSYSDTRRDDIIKNGYNVATMANGTADVHWTACVSCAILAKSFARTNTTPPALCRDCYSSYCWNGTTNSSLPAAYEPDGIKRSAGGGKLGPTLAMLTAFCCLLLMF